MPTMTIQLPERLAGAVWGHLVGDALGVPYEFHEPEQIHDVVFGARGSHHQLPGTWSDDGALMLALLDSLLRARGQGEARFDPADQARRFLSWADRNAYTPDGDPPFDIGGATSAALTRLRLGTPPEEAGGTGERDNGNGSLMRILPLALDEREVTDAMLVDHARRASAITHAHPVAQTACALYVLVARRLLDGAEPAAALSDATLTLRGIHAPGEGSSRWAAALDLIEGWSGRSGSGYVVDAFWSAWDAFAGASSYRETIERAVRYGHDTDTTACIAGGLAGIHWGIDGIPAPWLADMRGRAIVARLVDGLIETDGWQTSSAHPIRVDWIDLSHVPSLATTAGRLGMTFLPGKERHGMTGLNWRDLDADLARLHDQLDADTLLLLVEDHELRDARVSDIASVCAAHGIDLVRFPIPDLTAPTDREAFGAQLDECRRRIEEGRTVVVACRAGMGRTGTAVGCLLRDAGLDAATAIALTRESRPGTIETPAQEDFVRAWP
jgi:ADP-ribosylglycohydrolase